MMLKFLLPIFIILTILRSGHCQSISSSKWKSDNSKRLLELDFADSTYYKKSIHSKKGGCINGIYFEGTYKQVGDSLHLSHMDYSPGNYKLDSCIIDRIKSTGDSVLLNVSITELNNQPPFLSKITVNEKSDYIQPYLETNDRSTLGILNQNFDLTVISDNQTILERNFERGYNYNINLFVQTQALVKESYLIKNLTSSQLTIKNTKGKTIKLTLK